MGQFVLKRIAQLIPVILGIILLTFILMYVVPGDPVLSMVGQRYDEATLEQLRESFHLNDPLIKQFGHYLWGLAHGDLGISFTTRRPVMETVLERFPATMILALGAMFISVLLGLSVGILSSIKPHSWLDRSTMVVALLGVSAPVFWVGLLLVIGGRAVGWPYLTGYGCLPFLILPAITLGTRSAAFLARVTRANMLEILSQDYIRTAKAKGLSNWIVVLKHALKNTMIPIITIIGIDFGSYLSGAVLTESIFNWPGVGRLALNAILKRDFPVIQGVVLLAALVFVMANFIVDLLYGYLDPRIRLQGKK
ncbi:MAG TPA: peptide ABC transporter permease [Candidatus Marinimicrobia bacterium]|nr:MAG: peptide ABC transporter permease [Candidatus Marinimicrobia bacterium CG_4_10_14_0_2_um_filter_48_9]HCW77343.1 peptide ABC transporter permease [Candidatus Neomarinimicrobiota bacterium]